MMATLYSCRAYIYARKRRQLAWYVAPLAARIFEENVTYMWPRVIVIILK